MAFEETDLNVSQAEIDDLKAALANTGTTNAFVNAMAETEQKVRTFTSARTVPEETLQRLWRVLVLYALNGLVGPMPPYRKEAADKADKELEAIRDGKFPQYPLITSSDLSVPVIGAWGSGTKVELR
jgi:hypothetical protein